ncbi:hypothetical protein P1J78_22830 [Psychromarinibacter sp. C21-152]|uniref:Uncharacterized protein n=1 Tax=Psychromarinibacter sediminicola TaxID=3033385 RepID=A0AAE3NXR2_9RHOB|nr:hypothetical protein [Psychromarinibacter sediminicola]MDF0603569.1 hypothetical protein [Psychromarinibacter sediminicola]
MPISADIETLGRRLADTHHGTWREDVAEAMTYALSRTAWWEDWGHLYPDGTSIEEAEKNLHAALVVANM